MPARPNSSTLVIGLILIAVGAIFLAENFYPYLSAWRIFLRYWPVILIIIGVKKLVDYFTWPKIPPPPEKGM